MALERLPQASLVLGERIGVAVAAELLQQACRPFDVGEEEGDGATRQIAHTPMIRQKELDA